MKNPVESLLEDDHESLGQLLTELEGELAKHKFPRAFELLDLFWARLAIHIRAENLHLFPALANVRASLFTGKGGLPTRDEAHNVLLQLRSDHDFFMKELAGLIRAMRDIADNQQARANVIEDVRQRMIVIKNRLEAHNRLEEDQVYTWPSLLFDEPMVARLSEDFGTNLKIFRPDLAKPVGTTKIITCVGKERCHDRAQRRNCFRPQLPARQFRANNAESVRQFQPRVALWQPWERHLIIEDATLKELRGRLLTPKPRNPFQGCEQFPRAFLDPGFQSKLWADISQRFQRYSIF